MIFSLYICGKIIRVDTITDRFKKYCKGYLIKEPAPEADYCISISQSDFDALRLNADGQVYGIDEGFAIMRKLSIPFLYNENTILMHGAVVAYKKSAFMFMAPSGTGKTTHAGIWLKNLSDAYILNGDKPFISIQDKVTAWGSPWCGSEHQNKNDGVELKAICLLERADNNKISEITFEQALPMMLRHIGITGKDETTVFGIRLLGELKDKVRFYRFNMNNMKDDAFSTSFEQLKKLI